MGGRVGAPASCPASWPRGPAPGPCAGVRPAWRGGGLVGARSCGQGGPGQPRRMCWCARGGSAGPGERSSPLMRAARTQAHALAGRPPIMQPPHTHVFSLGLRVLAVAGCCRPPPGRPAAPHAGRCQPAAAPTASEHQGCVGTQAGGVQRRACAPQRALPCAPVHAHLPWAGRTGVGAVPLVPCWRGCSGRRSGGGRWGAGGQGTQQLGSCGTHLGRAGRQRESSLPLRGNGGLGRAPAPRRVRPQAWTVPCCRSGVAAADTGGHVAMAGRCSEARGDGAKGGLPPGRACRPPPHMGCMHARCHRCRAAIAAQAGRWQAPPADPSSTKPAEPWPRT